MISDKQPHTYIDQGRKFYAFFENYQIALEDGAQKKGFHFYCFDQYGFCWFSLTNPSRQFMKNIANGIFLQRPAWQGEGFGYRNPLETFQWLDGNLDSAYALETIYQLTGLDFALIMKWEAAERAPDKK